MILEVDLANDVDNDLSLQGTLLGVANNALVLSLGFKTMSLFELAILGIFCHGCLWFVFDQGNPNGFPKSQTPAFTFYAPILALRAHVRIASGSFWLTTDKV